MSNQQRIAQVPALTGVRALAAYMVFFHHYPITSVLVGELGFCMLAEGHVGVSIFFVLSGFVIAYNYSDQFSKSYRGYLRFLQNRFARIYPVYLLTTVVALLYLKRYDTDIWFYNLTLLRGFFGKWYFSHIGQAWSLTVEFTFYLLAPFLLRMIGRVPIGIICLGIYAIGAGLTLTPIGSEDFFSPYRMVVINTFFGRCFEFLVGIWLFKHFKGSQGDVPRKPRFISLCTYAGLILTFGCIYVFAECSWLAIYSPTCAPIHHYLFPPIVALFLYGLWKEDSFLSRLLSTRLMQLLGKSSYAFYLIHAAPFQEMFGLDHLPIGWSFLIINLIAIALYSLYERPLHLLLRAKKR